MPAAAVGAKAFPLAAVAILAISIPMTSPAATVGGNTLAAAAIPPHVAATSLIALLLASGRVKFCTTIAAIGAVEIAVATRDIDVPGAPGSIACERPVHVRPNLRRRLNSIAPFACATGCPASGPDDAWIRIPLPRLVLHGGRLVRRNSHP